MRAFSVRNLLYTCCPAALRPLWQRIEASDVGYRLARGTFWALTGTVVARGLGLVSGILIARVLGEPEVYGQLSVVRGTIETFGVFAGFGLGMTASKHVAQFRKGDPQRAGRIIAVSALMSACTALSMAAVLFFAAETVAQRLLERTDLAPLLRVGAVWLFFGTINGAQVGALSGFEAFKTIARLNCIMAVLGLFVLLTATVWGGLPGAVWGFSTLAGLNWLLNHLALRHEAHRAGVPLTFARCLDEIPVLWRFSLPAALSGLMVAPVNYLCALMLIKQPDGYTQQGVYEACNQWFLALQVLPGLLGNVLLPVMSERLGCQDHARSRQLLRLAMTINAAVVIPMALLIAMFGKLILAGYGKQYVTGWPTLVIVLGTSALLAVQTPVGQVIAASGRLWMGMLMNVGWAACFLGLGWLLVGFGAAGIASARAVAYCVHATWTFGFALKLLRPH